MDLPVIASPQPLHLPFDLVAERVGGRGIGVVAERCIDGWGEGGSDGGT